MISFTQRAAALLGVILTTGCAYTSVDASGQQTVIGLVYLTLPSPQRDRAGGSRIETRSVGLVGHNTPAQTSLTLGYSATSATYLTDQSGVFLINPPAPVPPPEN